MMNQTSTDMQMVFRALKFAAGKHALQRRKGGDDIPYINHPIEVAMILATVAEVDDADILAAAILHDTVEDTETLESEIETEFGAHVLSLVMECTDDTNLPKERRKEAQIQSAPKKTAKAKLIKLADKTSNVGDMGTSPPKTWSLQRRREYLDWTEKVVVGLRGQNKRLDQAYDNALAAARVRLEHDEKENQ
jgi:guanosine-3',5'-bis(diphosphate) 3'-pyrophosphohydrolase